MSHIKFLLINHFTWVLFFLKRLWLIQILSTLEIRICQNQLPSKISKLPGLASFFKLLVDNNTPSIAEEEN